MALKSKWLAEGGARTHIIATGTRYFSFFTDAGNFGSNMGFASVVFAIGHLYFKQKHEDILYNNSPPGTLWIIYVWHPRGNSGSSRRFNIILSYK